MHDSEVSPVENALGQPMLRANWAWMIGSGQHERGVDDTHDIRLFRRDAENRCGLNEPGRQRITKEGPLYPRHGLAHRSQRQEVTDDHLGPGGPQRGAALILFPHHRTDLVTACKELVHELRPDAAMSACGGRDQYFSHKLTPIFGGITRPDIFGCVKRPIMTS